jgi:hypothetical protein
MYLNLWDLDFKGLSSEIMFFLKIYKRSQELKWSHTPWKIQKCCGALS